MKSKVVGQSTYYLETTENLNFKHVYLQIPMFMYVVSKTEIGIWQTWQTLQENTYAQ